MESSNLYFDPFRKKWVKNRPEELIRSSLIHKMVYELGYPLSYIAIERSLHALLSPPERGQVPNRRLDVVVFSKSGSTLFPLLLVEVKAIDLTSDAAFQLIGYNAAIRAPYLALANGAEVLTGRYVDGHYQFVKGLPPYTTLLEGIPSCA